MSFLLMYVLVNYFKKDNVLASLIFSGKEFLGTAQSPISTGFNPDTANKGRSEGLICCAWKGIKYSENKHKY